MYIYVWEFDDNVSIDGVTIVILAKTEEDARILYEAARVKGAGITWYQDIKKIPVTRVLSTDIPTVVAWNGGGIE